MAQTLKPAKKRRLESPLSSEIDKEKLTTSDQNEELVKKTDISQTPEKLTPKNYVITSNQNQIIIAEKFSETSNSDILKSHNQSPTSKSGSSNLKEQSLIDDLSNQSPRILNVKSLLESKTNCTEIEPIEQNLTESKNLKESSHNPKESKTQVILKTETENDQHEKSTKVLENLSCASEKAYLKLIPSINKVEGHTCHDLLVEALRQYREPIPIDDFYNLLYNSKSISDVVSVPSDGLKIDKTERTDSTVDALNYSSLILETFRLRESRSRIFASDLVSNRNLSSLKFHEILRVFLAVKIIFDLARPIEDTTLTKTSLQRMSIYKAYYIICHKLIKKYPTLSNSVRLQQNLVLGQAQMGKLTKLVYRDAVTRRLGKRGKSRFHYLGMTWNKCIIDDEITNMVELELPVLERYFKEVHDTNGYVALPTNKKPDIPNDLSSLITPDIFMSTPLSSSFKKPPYTFVDISCKFPTICPPRSWNVVPGSIPQQSEWSETTTKFSVDALKAYNLSFEFLAHDLISEQTHNHFLEDIMKSICHLIDILASNEAFLHFYLIILLRIFPAVIASDEEVPTTVKVQLVTCMKRLVTSVEVYFEKISPTQKSDLITFTLILKRMIHINTMLRARMKTALIKNTLNEIIHDSVQLADIQLDSSSKVTKMSEVITHAVFMALKAFNFNIMEQGLKIPLPDCIGIIVQISKSFEEICKNETDFLRQIVNSIEEEKPKRGEDFDLVFQMFVRLAVFFHSAFLSNPIISELPTVVMGYIVVQIMNEMQIVSFHDFGKREKKISQETFKTWWVYSMVNQEYFAIVSEIVALSSTLNSGEKST